MSQTGRTETEIASGASARRLWATPTVIVASASEARANLKGVDIGDYQSPPVTGNFYGS